ncbi:hypothetical protein H7C19_29090 [Cohnella nanjingensis]|uniref:Uncharacterized protein n=1 Tax=Cohnella nanjingensis TaxID=1387779 RepID=A0A7X0RW46_9BACL|nr:hypothetical protein [Cohnella nanjingensis]MBB6674743.1 hypothetical protein [Cohnella nanjingensis]
MEPSDKQKPGAKRDHPEQYPTDKESLFDRFLSERNVDPIPVEDLTLAQKDERRKEETKRDSSSDRKYE